MLDLPPYISDGRQSGVERCNAIAPGGCLEGARMSVANRPLRPATREGFAKGAMALV